MHVGLAKKKTLTCRFFLFTIFPKNIKFRYPFVSNTYNRHKLLHGNVSYIYPYESVLLFK